MSVADPDSPGSLADLISRRASDAADAVYLEDARSERTVTFGGLAEAVAAWRRVFDALGLGGSAPVLVDVADPLGFAVVHLAALAHGLRSLPVDPSAPDEELDRLSGLIRGAALVGRSLRDTRTRFGGGSATRPR